MSAVEATSDATAAPARIKRDVPWWKTPWFDVVQFALLIGLLVWITWRGAASMEYRWQWYRLQFLKDRGAMRWSEPRSWERIGYRFPSILTAASKRFPGNRICRC